VQYKTLLEEGYPRRAAARKLSAHEATARYWLKRPDRLTKPPGAQPKIPDEKVKEIIQWFTGHFDRRVKSLKEI
jgi:transposase